METIEIKNINGVVLFSHTAENNSIKITVEEAVKKNVCLTLADLEGANLAGANLKGAIFREANLRDTNLRYTNLEKADLAWACLSWADLAGANLEGAKLEDADLSWANLIGANLEDANLKDANLKGAILIGANLKGADIDGAVLNAAHLNGAKNIPYIPLACPSEGAFIGWKKVEWKYLVKIQVPEDARRCSPTTRKCRCDKAMVLDITSLDGEEHYNEVVNYNYTTTVYKVGEMVYPNSFDDYRWLECSTGIHFFVNKQDAINY